MQSKNSKRKHLENVREKRNTLKPVQAAKSMRNPLKLMEKNIQ